MNLVAPYIRVDDSGMCTDWMWTIQFRIVDASKSKQAGSSLEKDVFQKYPADRIPTEEAVEGVTLVPVSLI